MINSNTPTSPEVTTHAAEWLRIKDACRLVSVSRSFLYELIGSGKVKSISLRKVGNNRGARRVNAESLRLFFKSYES
jgi:excisionase family DNA binding protein